METDRQVKEGDTVSSGRLSWRVLSVPGHTANHIALVVDGIGSVFSGDTLFAGGCGRLFGGTAAQMWNSLLRLRGLPDDTLLYPGHEYTLENMQFAVSVEPDNLPVRKRLDEVRALVGQGKPAVPSTIGVEKQTNPFFRADDPALRRAVGMEKASAVNVFAELRRRKDRF
jgi:hydroxyacylglutathione hydrolase